MKHHRTLLSILEVARTGSIRGAAEKLAITPSALTRKVKDFEDELGSPIFERMSDGMRLNAAGELVLRHIRDQLSDFERVRSQVADLSGIRRGHVTVACSQAFAHGLLPEAVAAYQTLHPRVSFSILVRDHRHAIAAVKDFEADVALVLQPPPDPDFHPIAVFNEPWCAFMQASHPLTVHQTVRMRDCLAYPVAMPGTSLAVRHLLDPVFARSSVKVQAVVESDSFEVLRNCVGRGEVISFQIRRGLPTQGTDIVTRPIDSRDLLPASIVLGQLRGRFLSVAAAKFSDDLSKLLQKK